MLARISCGRYRSLLALAIATKTRQDFATMSHTLTTADTFLYFGYGSNQLIERLRIKNKSANFVTTGKVSDYSLAFSHFSLRWQGHVATITKEDGGEVWGCVYSLNMSDMKNLDAQEGVHLSVYRPITVMVETEDGKTLECRAYQLIRPLEENAKPSDVYKNVIIKGAIQHSVPVEYIEFLKSIETNGYQGEVDVKLSLE